MTKRSVSRSLRVLVTRVQMTNLDKVEGLRGPGGQFINVERYPPGDYRGVSAPNADTLYWPRETAPSILPPGKGTWQPPAVTMVK